MRPNPHCLAADSALAELITSCPAAGQGVHAWVWQVAVRLRGRVGKDEIKRLLAIATKDCGRDCARDIEDAVENSHASGHRAPGARSSGHLRSRTTNAGVKVPVNYELRLRIAEGGRHAAHLRAASPTEVPESQPEISSFVLDRLFVGDPLLCVAVAQNCHCTARKSQLENPLVYSFIVPSPMATRWGFTKQGQRSERCLDNVGPRKYLVCEFDLCPDPDQLGPDDAAFVRWAASRGLGVHDVSAALLTYIGEAAPLVLVVDSGGKSLHGWYNVEGWPDQEVRDLMRFAACLGADPATYLACQLVRMPGGVRRNRDGGLEAFQDVFYFNEALCASSSKERY